MNDHPDLPKDCATHAQCDGFASVANRDDCPKWLRVLILSILNRAAFFEARAELLAHGQKAHQEVFDRARLNGDTGSMAASAGTIDGGRPFLMVVGVGDGAETLHQAISKVSDMRTVGEFPPITPPTDTPNHKGPSQ